MAIISIPTSINGVLIPGGVINGPLGALFSNPYDQTTLQYPRNLQSSTRGHVVHFTVKEVNPIGFEDFKNAAVDIVAGGSDLLNSAISIFKGQKSLELPTTSGVLGSVANVFESSGLSFQPRRDKIVGNIFLYTPETMYFNYGVSYDDSTSLLSAGAGMLKPIVEKLTGSKAGPMSNAITSMVSTGIQSGAASLGMSKLGYAVNPQLQMLFKGIGFREYQMAFVFTPYSKQETDQVNKIIKMFRTHAAPKIVTGAAGMFFIPPSSFDIDFMFNGKTNKNLNRVTESVITNIDVNYSPNGWSTYDDGAPVQTTLTIQFKEIQLVDRAMVEKGY